MKKILLLIFAMTFALGTNVFAQSSQNTTTQQEKKSPFDGVIKFNKDTIDFGETAKNKPVKVTFTFKNISKKPIFIQDAQASCGCTTPSYTKAPILPGKEGEVTAVYNASGSGKIYKTVFVNFKDIPKAKQLILTGKVKK